jgi:subtilisin family serine protease
VKPAGGQHEPRRRREHRQVDDAVRAAADSGVVFAIAAGNSGADACTQSPARAGTHNGVITVAATAFERR